MTPPGHFPTSLFVPLTAHSLLYRPGQGLLFEYLAGPRRGRSNNRAQPSQHHGRIGDWSGPRRIELDPPRREMEADTGKAVSLGRRLACARVAVWAMCFCMLHPAQHVPTCPKPSGTSGGLLSGSSPGRQACLINNSSNNPARRWHEQYLSRSPVCQAGLPVEWTGRFKWRSGVDERLSATRADSSPKWRPRSA